MSIKIKNNVKESNKPNLIYNVLRIVANKKYEVKNNTLYLK